MLTCSVRFCPTQICHIHFHRHSIGSLLTLRVERLLIIWKLFLWQWSILQAEHGACRLLHSRLVGAWGEVGCSLPTQVPADPRSVNEKSGGNVL